MCTGLEPAAAGALFGGTAAGATAAGATAAGAGAAGAGAAGAAGTAAGIGAAAVPTMAFAPALGGSIMASGAGAGAAGGAAGASSGLLGGSIMAAAPGVTIGSALPTAGLGSGISGMTTTGLTAGGGTLMPSVGASGLMEFATPSVFETGSGFSGLSSMPTAAEAVPWWQSALGQAKAWHGQYGKQVSKGMENYQKVNSAIKLANPPQQPGRMAPPPMQIRSQETGPMPLPTISGGNNFARMLAERRQRNNGLLG